MNVLGWACVLMAVDADGGVTADTYAPLTEWQVEAIKVLVGSPIAAILLSPEDVAAVRDASWGVMVELSEAG